MSLDPTNYDLGELRSVSGLDASPTDGRTDRRDASQRTVETGAGTGPGTDRQRDPVSARDAFKTATVEELLDRELAAPPDCSDRPYVVAVPDSYAGLATVLEWLDFLVRRVGEEGAREALGFYETIGWLSPEVAADLRTYLAGLDAPGTPAADRLGVDDHRLSLVYVARLAGIGRSE